MAAPLHGVGSRSALGEFKSQRIDGGIPLCLVPSNEASLLEPLVSVVFRRPSRIRTPSPWWRASWCCPYIAARKSGSTLSRRLKRSCNQTLLSQPTSSPNPTSGSARVLSCNFRSPAGKLCSRDAEHHTRGRVCSCDLPRDCGPQCVFRNDL